MAKKTTNDADSTGYTGQPIGKNTLCNMMKRLSNKAHLSRQYTNHSVRATCVTKLSEKGVPENIIMATSGHKSVESLKAFNRPTEVQSRQTASMLDIDEALALASPRELAQLEEPNTHLFVDGPRRERARAALPMNFCGN